MKTMKLEVISSESMIISCDCEFISLPSTEGIIELRPNHEKIMIQLKSGNIIYKHDEKLDAIPVKLGFATVHDEICKVIIL